MTLDEFTKRFPARGVSLIRTERGAQHERKLVWVASWASGYFTSDSDRHVGLGYSEVHQGDTPEEALDRLALAEISGAKATVRSYETALQEARDKLSAATQNLERRI